MAQTTATPNIFRLLFAKPSETIVAMGVIGIIAVMVMPIPPWGLDILLSFSITFALVILLVSIFMKSALDFTVFPSLLLIVTLLRLSLNVATTRVILLHGGEGTGAAGEVIESFGSFVVGGNYVVGTVIFIILVMINFIVITKGSVRTSEVAARFTLDAIPGKQMSIDADLNAGIITDMEAKARREKLEHEADFYGAMDGAIRFVRGDAIAGILITLINILGGFAIGVFQESMDAAEAAQVYTLLTIGDGLVSQLPALVISTAAGLVVTRATSAKNMPAELIEQLLNQPTAFLITAGALFFFGLIPGLPHVPFLALSLLAGFIGMMKFKDIDRKKLVETRKKEDEAKAPVQEKVESILPLDMMELEVGYELIPLVDSDRNGELLDRIKSVRRQFALEMGFIVPPLHIRDNLQLKSNEYGVLIKGVEVARGSIMMGRILAMNPGTAEREIDGIVTTEPTFGLPAVWITPAAKQEAQMAGYTVVDPATVITTHIKETIKRHAHELMGRQEAQALVDKFKESNPKVIEELIPNVLSLGKVQRVLRNLLKEQISIRDLRTILETLADYGSQTTDPDLLTEYVRQSLARPITKQYQGADGSLSVMTLDRRIEDILEGSIQKSDTSTFLALEPTVAEKLLQGLKEAVEAVTPNLETAPILLASPMIRQHLRKFTERFMPELVILSHGEIVSNVQIRNLKIVGINAG
ncbi:MAG: flagellar biosynthesis protein FlhA [Candidatus Nitrohelix vancouverensis]|uniref:Flagellar biosynthesis protein FlhA n=1 Tax=Candidatus Nitrohelix vancouverensis TaxID=2705534 RepID=A0A7T0G3L1_9BACT|nr:MAG: flagellar biosynthesis protein FlhA [Candidatus Nitrohelix vancouverensis]